MLPLNTPEGHVSSLGVPKESLSATAAAAAGGGSVQDTVIPYDHVGLDHSQKSTKEQVLLDKIEKLIQSKSNKSEKSDKGSPTVISGTPAYDLDKPDSYLDNTTHDGSWPITNNSRAHSPEVGGGVGHGHAGGGIPPPTHRRDSNPLTRRKKVTLFGTKAVSGRTAALHDSETAGGSFWIDGERVGMLVIMHFPFHSSSIITHLLVPITGGPFAAACNNNHTYDQCLTLTCEHTNI